MLVSVMFSNVSTFAENGKDVVSCNSVEDKRVYYYAIFYIELTDGNMLHLGYNVDYYRGCLKYRLRGQSSDLLKDRFVGGEILDDNGKTNSALNMFLRMYDQVDGVKSVRTELKQV